MFNINDLERQINIVNDTIKCTIKNCKTYVKIQSKKFIRDNRFLCPVHNIYISPSTYDYLEEKDNLLDFSSKELQLLNEIKKFKRECRLSRERSEDAVTWNVFRALTNSMLLSRFLEITFDDSSEIIDTVFWSVSLNEKQPYKLLNKARTEFGETIERGTEPDLIIETKDTVYFIEAKLTASNRTPNKKEIDEKKNNPKKYKTGGNKLFNSIFNSSYENQIDLQFYELSRLWLLGNWISKESCKNFVLVNLVLAKKEKEIETSFGGTIIQDKTRYFKRITWESIYSFFEATNSDLPVLDYMKYKSFGYSSNGEKNKGFSL